MTTAKRLAEFKTGSGRYASKERHARAESPVDAIDAIRAATDVMLDSPIAEFEAWLRAHPAKARRALAELDEAARGLELLRQSFARCV